MFLKNLNMIRPKNLKEDLLLSITEKCEMLIEQTLKKPEETLEIKMIKPREIFHFTPPVQIKGNWMIGLTDLEKYNSVINITEENNKFKLYKFPDEKSGAITYGKVRDEIERDLDISGFTAADLQYDLIAPSIIEEDKEQVTKRMKNKQYMNIVAGYVSSVFQEFESFLRTEVDFIEDDIKWVLDDYNSSFFTSELQPGIYTFKDISEALFNILQTEYPGPSNVIVIEFDDFTRKTKLVVEDGIIPIRLEEKSFFSTSLGFTSGWEYKHYNKFTNQKIVNLSSTNKMHLKCDVVDGSIHDGFRQPVLFSFVSEKPSGYKVFCKPETIHYKKIIKSVLKTITFYLQDDNNEEGIFYQEALTFTLQLTKI